MSTARLRKTSTRQAKPAPRRHQSAAEALSDLRSAYAVVDPDRDYPPLKLKSLKGKVSAAEWEARVDCACAYRLVKRQRSGRSSNPCP